MAHAVVSDLSTKITKGLANLLIQEIQLVIGVEEELKNLNEHLSTINDILLDAEEKGAMNRQVEKWLTKVKDIAYDAEDVFDECATKALEREVEQAALDRSATQVLRQGVPAHPNNIGDDQVLSCFTFFWEMMVQRCFLGSNQLVFRSEMAHRIKDIIKRLDDIEKDPLYSTFRSIPDQKVEFNADSLRKRHTDPYLIETRVFGREKDKEILVKLLTTSSSEGDNNVKVIPIIGIGGLGKTTLAHYVYDDDKVQKHFDPRMWVCVSFDSDVVLLANKILESMEHGDDRVSPVGVGDKAISLVRKKLSGKRYLLVLDDVWNEEWDKWDKLRNLLMGSGVGRGSVIMVTTRSKGVASMMQVDESLRYELKLLNENVCQSLFNECAFGLEPNHRDQELVEIGKKIVKKCGGVPLAIKALGNLLSRSKEKIYWSNVLNTEIWNLQGEGGILPALRISYNQLPSPHLKQCFAYCSLFPQDHVIEVNDLVHQWMAHGFIQPPRGQESPLTIEDIGHGYFSELLLRSFFQEEEKDRYGNIVRCKMHDLMHNLARSVAPKECQEVPAWSSTLSPTPEGVRHMVVAFHGNKEGGSADLIIDALVKPTDDDKAKKLRTLSLQRHSSLHYLVGLQLSDGSVSAFRGLRVLNLSYLRMELVPSSIGDMQQLRYLDLSRNYFKALPNSICCLYNLQTLRLNRCNDLNEWPRDITKMVRLRHLELRLKMKGHIGSLKYMPRGLGQLTSLHTLGTFIVGNPDDPTIILENGGGGLWELRGLNQLRGKLRIEGLQNVGDARDAEEANLRAKLELQILSLSWSSPKKQSLVDEQLVLENLQPHQNLKGLKIGGYGGAKMPSWIIRSSSLPYLVKLSLFNCGNIKFLPLIGEFRSLKFLKLDCLTGLKSICNKVAVRGGRGGGEVKPLELFPFLEELELSRLRNFERWTMSVVDGDGEGEEDEEEEDNHLHLLSSMFRRLTRLSIHACPKLTTLPILSVGGRQHLLPLRHLDIGNLDTLVSLPDFPAPETLEVLSICNCASLERLPDCFFDNLKVLSRFEITGCSALTTLPEGIRHLTALKRLEIWHCPSLITLPQGLANLSSLEELRIVDCPNLSSLPEGIRARRKIERCPGLIALPMNSPKVSLSEDDD